MEIKVNVKEGKCAKKSSLEVSGCATAGSRRGPQPQLIGRLEATKEATGLRPVLEGDVLIAPCAGMTHPQKRKNSTVQG